MREVLSRSLRGWQRTRIPADRALVAVAMGANILLLVGVGLLFVHSTMSEPGDAFPGSAAMLQAAKAIAGLGALGVVLLVDYRFFDRNAYLIFVAVAGILVGTLFSPSVKNANRWIEIGRITIQPSEFAKIAFVLAMARYLKFRSNYRTLRGLLGPFLLAFVPMLFIARQPDLGSAFILPPTLFAMLYVAGARPRHLGAIVLAGVALAPVAYHQLAEYQQRRIDAYLWPDRQDLRPTAAYQLTQSKIALGSGGALGRGYHQGTQNTLGYLPVANSDFIFSAIGEEWGFVGATGVVLLYVLLFYLAFQIAVYTREPFGRLLVVGITSSMVCQTIMNTGMTVGMTPITGIPLPLVSYGGSSLVATMLGIGLILNVALRPVRVVAPDDLNLEEDEGAETG